MRWVRPPKTDPCADRYIDGPDGWRICKALVHGKPIYTLSRSGTLVFTGTLADCKRTAATAAPAAASA